MNSILNEISKLRGGSPIRIDRKNRNRHCILVQETDGTKTAYCFSVPIYNIKTRKLLDRSFHSRQQGAYVCGSNADITVDNEIRMENAEGFCRWNLNAPIGRISNKEIACGADSLFPTTNGLAWRAWTKNGPVRFTLEGSSPLWTVRANDKYFALMQEEFRPFVTVFAIGTANAAGEVIAPARVDYQKLSDQQYELTVSPLSPMGSYVLLEINLHEPKLFQDTTVESANPKTNNAFGGVAFLGTTAAYGEQWLYSRQDFSSVIDMLDKQVNRAMWHLPYYGVGTIPLSTYRTKARFCSFGSNWDNKVAAASSISDSESNDGYQSLNITALITNSQTKHIIPTDGLILKPKVKNSGFSVIATGDSYYSPQILEMNFLT